MKTQISILFLLITVTLSAQHTESSGKQIFEKHCSKCHGKTGTRGLFGAKNLQISILDDQKLLQIIISGKRIMPSWRKRLSAEEIQIVMGYVKTLRKI